MIPLSHTGDTFIIAKAATDLPACDAHIVFKIDAEEYKRPVRLVNGMSKASREATVLSLDHLPF